ncbi:MAG: TonB-dependent receptor [Limnohabitans sp.]|nr:TonB-dependent receptor [Limnohabitans sp.]
MLKNILLLGVLFLLASNLVNGQTKVQGRVTNEENIPIQGVTIKIQNATYISDSLGLFFFPPARNVMIHFSHIGYLKHSFLYTNQNFLNIKLSSQKNDLEEVQTVGSRFNYARVNIHSPIPVDKINIQDLNRTGQLPELGEMLQYVVPSFNNNRISFSGASSYASPSSLKGLFPDQTLVLIEGKRLHKFSTLNSNYAVGKGTVSTDINTIPSISINNLEVLKDGAAAQYGSDAIAGIIQLNLRRETNKWLVKYFTSITSQGDGYTNSIMVNYGFKIRKTGFLNFSYNYILQQETNRAGKYTGKIYSTNQTTEDSLRLARKVYPIGPVLVSIFGQNRIESHQFFYNSQIPLLRAWQLYSFGGISNRYITAFGVFRSAIPSDPTTNPAIYPDGYPSPRLPGLNQDLTTVLGLKKKWKNSWFIDISSSFGANSLKLFAFNTTNPSLGINSPKDFYSGANSYSEWVSELNVSKFIPKIGFISNVSIAFGSQYRLEYFSMSRGDSASYVRGPLAFSTTNPKGVGSIFRIGIGPNNETAQYRSNLAYYLDLEGELTPWWLLGVALRYERYSDFGSNISFKLASNWQLFESFSIRASFNKGFRAPSLQQIFNNQTTITGSGSQFTENVRSNNPGLAAVGVPYPKPEIAYNYNFGLVYKFKSNFSASIDAYLIDIKDRIIITQSIPVAGVPNLMKYFTTQKEISFFTNQINTRTMGIDYLANYNLKLNTNSRLIFNVALTFNQTKILDILPPPPEFYAGAEPKYITPFIDSSTIGIIESSQPKIKWNSTISYIYKNLTLTSRLSYFGEVRSFEKRANGTYLDQLFSPKYLLDLNINYNLTKNISISGSINNILDTYPDELNPNSINIVNGQILYSRQAFQIPYNGRNYSLSLQLLF